jgi:hypothetical protein
MYKKDPGTGFSPDALVRDEADTASPENPLLCAACRVRITWKEASISINGRHKHVFINPAGLVFELGCFSMAENLSGLGTATSEFTWFPGYSWQTMFCSDCHSQLGWSYHKEGGSTFFGFILDRLVDG